MNKKERFCDVDNIVEWRHIITALLAFGAMVGQGISEANLERMKAAKRLKAQFIADISRENA